MPKDFDMIIRINTDRAEVEVEQHSKKGVVTRKNISPESLSNCILTSRGDDESHSTGLLPEGCIAAVLEKKFVYYFIRYPELYADFSYYETEYLRFPIPRLVFCFKYMPHERKVAEVRLCVVKDERLTQDIPTALRTATALVSLKMETPGPYMGTRADVEAILAGLADGTIDAIVTHHAPHTAQEKARPLPDAPSGMVGLETSLALALTGLYHTGLLPLARVLALMSASPAALLGLPKGTLEVGRDADLVLFDPEEEWTIDKEQFVSKGRNTPFHGRTVRGRIKYTISQGKIIYMEG